MTKEEYLLGYGALLEDTSNIKFHGRIPHTKAIEAVQESDFQFLIRDSNLKNNAGFPTKFVESFSCCIPMIATKTSNICDYLKDGENGILVSDKQTLKDALEKIVQMSKDEIIKMKEACRSFEGFDYHNYKNEFSKIFK